MYTDIILYYVYDCAVWHSDSLQKQNYHQCNLSQICCPPFVFRLQTFSQNQLLVVLSLTQTLQKINNTIQHLNNYSYQIKIILLLTSKNFTPNPFFTMGAVHPFILPLKMAYCFLCIPNPELLYFLISHVKFLAFESNQ